VDLIRGPKPQDSLKQHPEFANWSDEMVDFMQFVLGDDQKMRPTLDELLEHPFIMLSPSALDANSSLNRSGSEQSLRGATL